CFADEPLEQALRRAAELEFSRVDLGISDASGHVTPAQVVGDLAAVLTRIRQGPTIGVAGITLRQQSQGEEALERLTAVAQLAKQLQTAIVTVSPAPAGAPLMDEVVRLQRWTKAASIHGVVLCILTEKGTLAGTPDGATELCTKVPGLGLTLDPSHLLHGPAANEQYDDLFAYVRHVQLRDSGRGPDQFQVPVGRGEIDYSKIVFQLARYHYRGTLVVDIESAYNPAIEVDVEVRKLGRVLESLL
ncbi:MAG TPA: sugar phosphate isomerase/epimerase, partial [Planctomycetia bacterium]|nr:sugar phosphate isomerase/epimerase [Planctomycetia bacterium]